MIPRLLRRPAFFLTGALVLMLNTARADIGVISPQKAKELIEQSTNSDYPIVLDTRGGYKDYFRGHLPRAHHLNFDTLRGTDNGVPVQYLPDDLTASLLSRAGVDKDRVHIIYATGAALPNDEILSASMVAYVLEKFGVERIYIVDGGLAEWESLNLPTTQKYFGNPTGSLPAKRNTAISVGVDQVLEAAKKPNTLLIDARPYDEYLGQDDIWVRKGHIPGAISFHWAKLMDPSNTHKFLPFDQAIAELEKAGITADREIIVYCGTSREGSLLRFYLTHVAKYPNVKLYEGSWKEYASLEQFPAETEPSKTR